MTISVSERLAKKLEDILGDLELCRELLSYFRLQILPGMVSTRRLRQEQANQILAVGYATLESSLTPEQIRLAEETATRDEWREHHKASKHGY